MNGSQQAADLHTDEQIASNEAVHVSEDPETGITFITREEGERLIDRQARKYLGMSGTEFKRRYCAGTMDPECSKVIRVAMLLPFGTD